MSNNPKKEKRKNKLSLIAQVLAILLGLDRRGQSRHDAKDDHGRVAGIYSSATFDKYLRICCLFGKWCKAKYKCKTLSECRQYVDEWLSELIAANRSAHTIKLYACAVAKLFQCSTKDFIKTPARERKNITRSRGVKARDAHFSVENNSEIVNFCRSVGARRHEVMALRAGDLKYDKGNYYVKIKRGKGGKAREVLVVGDVQNVIDCFEKAKSDPYGRVFPKIPNAMDVHGYRREYAETLYNMVACDVSTLSKEETYRCRKDKRGIVYDIEAMLTVSENLGHNRIDVIAYNYLD